MVVESEIEKKKLPSRLAVSAIEVLILYHGSTNWRAVLLNSRNTLTVLSFHTDQGNCKTVKTFNYSFW